MRPLSIDGAIWIWSLAQVGSKIQLDVEVSPPANSKGSSSPFTKANHFSFGNFRAMLLRPDVSDIMEITFCVQVTYDLDH